MAPKTISPLHRSVTRNRAISPSKMDGLAIPDEMRQGIEAIVLDIFTEMTNTGSSLQATLSAIYMSGFMHGVAGAESAEVPKR